MFGVRPGSDVPSVEGHGKVKDWIHSLIVGFVLGCGSFLLSDLFGGEGFPYTQKFTDLSLNPLLSNELSQRFLVPLIGYLTGLSGPRYYLLSMLGTVLFLSIFHFWAARFYENKRDAFFLTLLLAGSPVVLFNNVVYGWADIYCYIFLLLALLNPRWVSVFILFGVFSHEMFLAFLPLIYLYHLRYTSDFFAGWNKLFQGLSFSLAVGVIVGTRLWIDSLNSGRINSLSRNPLKELQPLLRGEIADNYLLTGLLHTYEFASILLVVFVLYFLRNLRKAPGSWLLLGSALLPATLLLIATDTTRLWSNTFMFVALFPRFLPSARSKLIPALAVGNLLFPSYYIDADCPSGVPLDRIGKQEWVHRWFKDNVFFKVNRRLYRPGQLTTKESQGGRLEPYQKNKGAERWQVEKGISLHHFSQGEGKRKVLFVHGGPYVFGQPLMEPISALNQLSRAYTFHYYHQRGCGLSTRPTLLSKSVNTQQNKNHLAQTFGIARHIADIERIRRILGEEKLTFVAHSYGGLLAALYAAEFPQRVRGLILISPANLLVLPHPTGTVVTLMGKHLPKRFQEEYENHLGGFLNFSLRETDQKQATFVSDFARFEQSIPSRQGVNVPILHSKYWGGWMVAGAFLSMGHQFDYRPALAKVKTKVMILHGKKGILPLRSGQLYADSFSGSNVTFLTFQKSGSLLWMDQPERFSKVVREHLEKLDW